MPILVWSDDYSINVTEIDEQHKKLLEHVNKLHAGVEAQIDKQDLHQLVMDLYEYAVFHFSFEEKLMKQHGMDHIKKHHKEHKLLLKPVADSNQAPSVLAAATVRIAWTDPMMPW